MTDRGGASWCAVPYQNQESSSTYESVQDYYGKVLAGSKDLKTTACSGSKPSLQIIEALRLVPDEILEKFFGCGAPLPLGIEGLRVLDLGSGSGRDSYVCAHLVGEHGYVTGVDMTQELIQVSTRRSLTSAVVPACPIHIGVPGWKTYCAHVLAKWRAVLAQLCCS